MTSPSDEVLTNRIFLVNGPPSMDVCSTGDIRSYHNRRSREPDMSILVIGDLSTGFRSAVPKTVPLIVGDVGTEELVEEVIRVHDVTEIIHFAASIVVPDSVSNPLGYYRNNTVNARSLLAAAVKTGIKH